MVGSILSGLMMARKEPGPPMLIGLTLSAAGLLGLIVTGPSTPYPVLVLPMIASGLAMSLTMPAATAAVVEAAPEALSGLASAVVNAARQLGGALGVALLGSLIATALIATAPHRPCRRRRRLRARRPAQPALGPPGVSAASPTSGTGRGPWGGRRRARRGPAPRWQRRR